MPIRSIISRSRRAAISRRARSFPALASFANAFALVTFGAVSVGALAVARLAIRSLFVKDLHVGTLTVDSVQVPPHATA